MYTDIFYTTLHLSLKAMRIWINQDVAFYRLFYHRIIHIYYDFLHRIHYMALEFLIESRDHIGLKIVWVNFFLWKNYTTRSHFFALPFFAPPFEAEAFFLIIAAYFTGVPFLAANFFPPFVGDVAFYVVFTAFFF